MSHTFKSIAAFAAVGLIAGCSGGGTSPARVANTNPGATGGSPSTTAGKATGSLEVRLVSRNAAKRKPMGKRKPAYISPATGGIFATFASDAGTTTQGYTLAAGQTASAASPASCGALQSDNSYTCTLYFALSPASSPYTITLTAYDTAQSGTTVQAGTALSTDTATETVTANASNSFDFALQGIVAGFNVVPQYVGASQGAPIQNATATFTALDPDFYEIDAVDNATNFAVGTAPSDLNASFAVAAMDEGTCGDAAGTTCITSTSTAVTGPPSEAVNYAYDGNGSAGTGASDAPYYGVVTLSEPTDYSGYTSSTFGDTNYAGTLYVVPLFGLVDQTSQYKDSTSPSTVDFTGPNESIAAYTKQFAPPTGATGYTIDHSACDDAGSGAIATFTAPAAGTYGQTYTISSGPLAGSCTVNLTDGAGDTATITVNNGSTSATIPVPSPGPVYSPNAKVRK